MLQEERKEETPHDRVKVFESLKSYMLYFESFTFRLLRYDDYEEFILFFNELNSITTEMRRHETTELHYRGHR